MPETQKITVLLADEDTLRRDGLASVLRENAGIEILTGCSDGQTALDEIRELRPDVAIVDLNLPVLHGIELVRRIRGESLGTKIIILSGTMDDEIVREVSTGGSGRLPAQKRSGTAPDRCHQLRTRRWPVLFTAVAPRWKRPASFRRA